jgi:hypothetical protein
MKELLVGKRVVILDDEDFEWASKCAVEIKKNGFSPPYAYIGNVPVHQLVFAFSGRKVDPGNVIDHRNRKSLDNRRENLRQITNHENFCKNTKKNRNGSSKFIGVSWDKKRSLWRSQYTHYGMNTFVGHFETEEEAAKAHDLYAICNHRNPLRLNYPDEAYALHELIGKKD